MRGIVAACGWSRAADVPAAVRVSCFFPGDRLVCRGVEVEVYAENAWAPTRFRINGSTFSAEEVASLLRHEYATVHKWHDPRPERVYIVG